jgi:cyanate permease
MKTMALARNRRMVMDVVCVIVALIGGFVAGAVDFNNNEPQAAVIVIIAFAGALGFAQPRKAWRWAIIVGLGVPIVYLIATAFGYQPKSPPEPGWYASLIALIPAFFSTYCGVLLRMAISGE